MKTAKFLELRRFPMDFGRLVSSPVLLGFRMKKRWVGDRYRLRGGAIVVANHTAFSDPFLVGGCFWYRRVFFLASEEIVSGRVRSALLRGMGCIRIDRNIADLQAVRQATDTVREGRVLTVFGQGNIHRDGTVDAVKSGAVLIALRAGVPMVPLYSRKRDHWWQRRVVVIGEPMDVRALCGKRMPTMSELDALAAELQVRLYACKAEFDRMKGETADAGETESVAQSSL